MNETHVEPSGTQVLDYADPKLPDPAPPEGGSAEREAGVNNVLSSIVDPAAIEVAPPVVEAGAEAVSAMIDSSAEIAGGIFDAIVGSIG